MKSKQAKQLTVAGVCALSLALSIVLTPVRGESAGIQPNLLAEFLHNGFWAVTQVDSTLICAMDGGLGVLTPEMVDTSHFGATEPGLFKIRDFFPLESRPVSLRYANSTLIAQMPDGFFRFFELSSFLKLRELGSVNYPNEIQDYLFMSGNIYFAEEFRGLTMYHVNNFTSLSFVDSSMVGVRVIQLALSQDTLYALDDYNGILRYPNPEFGLQNNAGYLRLPFQIQSFTPHGDRLNLAVGDSGIKSATFDSLGFFDSLFERQTLSFAAKVFETDSNYIIFSTPNVFETQDKRDPGALNLIPVSGNTLGATLATFDNKQVLVTPSRISGLLGLWMNVTDYPQDFASFDHPGPIRGLNLVDGFLYTAGNGNPLEKYNILGANGPELAGVRGFPAGTNAVAALGDTLFMIEVNSVVPLLWAVTVSRDNLPWPYDTFGIPPEIDDISVHQNDDGSKLFLLRAGSKYFVNQAERFELFGSSTVLLNLGVGVTSATIERERVYHYSSKSKILTVSKLNRFLSVVELNSMPLPGAVNAMLSTNAGMSLLTFSSGRIRLIDIRERDTLILAGDFFVRGTYTDAVERDGLIFAVGPNSTGVLAFVNDMLEELYFEPNGANLVSAGTGMFATSDGSSIKLFEFLQTDVADEPVVLKPADFRLLENYPNPFNGETLIRYSGAPERRDEARIVVYNVLGRKVRELPVAGASGGVVRWDGRNENGAEVASGMYFARLISSVAGGRRAIKMIYLK